MWYREGNYLNGRLNNKVFTAAKLEILLEQTGDILKHLVLDLK